MIDAEAAGAVFAYAAAIDVSLRHFLPLLLFADFAASCLYATITMPLIIEAADAYDALRAAATLMICFLYADDIFDAAARYADAAFAAAEALMLLMPRMPF